MTRMTVRPLRGTGQDRTIGRRIATAALASLAVVASATAIAPGASAAPLVVNGDYVLPPCAADGWIEGMAVERYADGHFKIVVTPTPDARAFGRVGLGSMWHVVQACVPDLYDALADSIFGQLACHADFAALPGKDGEAFATGPTWDLESYRPAYQELDSIATKCSAGWFTSYGGDHPEAGEWEVYFGVDPIEKSEQDIERIKAERSAAEAASAAAPAVTVFNTGGIGLWTRGGPGYDAPRYEVLPDGTTMTLLCQTHSQLILDWISSDLWDFVELADGQQVWVSDVFVETGAVGQVAPSC